MGQFGSTMGVGRRVAERGMVANVLVVCTGSMHNMYCS
jgi:hypothetical protein